ncbi:hypothetical protein LGN17_18035 [Burkholderia sp. AU30280]|nr:hypothetical protein [Burkholderia sp. AU30280]MCA8274392.1 hypothetical protein [Burkholderia sp. AU30280]
MSVARHPHAVRAGCPALDSHGGLKQATNTIGRVKGYKKAGVDVVSM